MRKPFSVAFLAFAFIAAVGFLKTAAADDKSKQSATGIKNGGVDPAVPTQVGPLRFESLPCFFKTQTDGYAAVDSLCHGVSGGAARVVSRDPPAGVHGANITLQVAGDLWVGEQAQKCRRGELMPASGCHEPFAL